MPKTGLIREALVGRGSFDRLEVIELALVLDQPPDFYLFLAGLLAQPAAEAAREVYETVPTEADPDARLIVFKTKPGVTAKDIDQVISLYERMKSGEEAGGHASSDVT